MAASIPLSVARDGFRFRVRVSPGARRTAVCGIHGDALKVSVQAPPEKGQANAAVEALLTDRLGCGRATVRVVIGHGSRDKIVCVAGVELAELAESLARLADTSSVAR